MKRLFAALLSGALALSLAACGTNGDSPAPAGDAAEPQSAGDAATPATPDAAGKTYNVGVVLKTTSSEYWSYVIAGIEAAEKDLGNVTVKVNGATGDTAFDEQQNMVETLAQSGELQALAVAPLNSGMIANALKGAEIPILAVDTNFDAAQCFIGTAHEDAAFQGGKYVAEQVGAGGKVVVLANIQGELTSESRVKGYTDALTEGGCEIITTLYTDGVSDKAVTAMEGALQTYPEIDAVVCCADDVALGASRAIKSAGREGILVCGFDGISSGVQAVVDGDIACTVAQDPYNMGYQCVVSLVDVLEGKDVPAFIDTGCKVIDSGNAQEYLDKLHSLVA